MPQFILKIDLGNTPANSNDIGYALLDTGRKIRVSGKVDIGKVHDINGNVVGHYEVVE